MEVETIGDPAFCEICAEELIKHKNLKNHKCINYDPNYIKQIDTVRTILRQLQNYQFVLDALTATQARCNELLEENRKLKKELENK